MRKVYSLLTSLAAPFIPLYLLKRGQKNPEYRQNWHERFGFLLKNPSIKPIIWLHSVSVGETRAMLKIVELLEINYPHYQVLITTMTPTGRKTAQELYPNAIVHYVPYDISFCIKAFLKTFTPHICVIMETEIWPNLIYFTKKYGIPIFIANARLSEKSYRGYKKFNWALKPILNLINGILCQDGSTRLNFDKLDYTGKLSVTGNTKFDLKINSYTLGKISDFKRAVGKRKVIIFASTRVGEEELILSNLDFNLDVVYLIVPRHPERFNEVASLLQDKGIKYLRRSNIGESEDIKVVLGDSMGEMLAYYSISYLAVIGGSFGDFGGQSPIEALFMGVPVVFGASMYNFRVVAQNAVENKCAIQIEQVADLPIIINKMLSDKSYYSHVKNTCIEFINKNRGASERVVKEVAKYLN